MAKLRLMSAFGAINNAPTSVFSIKLSEFVAEAVRAALNGYWQILGLINLLAMPLAVSKNTMALK